MSKRFLLLLLGFLMLAGITFAEPAGPYLPYYWLTGNVSSNEVTVANRIVAFFKDWESGEYVTAETDVSGDYQINIFELYYLYGVPITGETEAYFVAVPTTESSNWGTGEVVYLDIDAGYTEENLILTLGGGGIPTVTTTTTTTSTSSTSTTTTTSTTSTSSTSTTTTTTTTSTTSTTTTSTSSTSTTTTTSTTTSTTTTTMQRGPIIALKLYLKGLYNSDTETQTATSVIIKIYNGDDPGTASPETDAYGETYSSGVITLDTSGEGSNEVVDSEGDNTLVTGDYYLVIKQLLSGTDEAGPNHLPVITNTKITLTSGSITNVDLTDSSADNFVEAYTPRGKVQALETLSNGNYAMRAGNLNNDNAVNVTDYSVWKGAITTDGDVDPDDPNSVVSDINGDDKINIVDYSLWKGTVQEFTPDDVPQTGAHIYVPGY